MSKACPICDAPNRDNARKCVKCERWFPREATTTSTRYDNAAGPTCGAPGCRNAAIMREETDEGSMMPLCREHATYLVQQRADDWSMGRGILPDMSAHERAKARAKVLAAISPLIGRLIAGPKP